MQLRGPMPVKGWSCGDFEVCARAGAATAHRNRPWPQGQAPGHIYANDNATPRTDAGQRVGVAVCYLQMTCAVRLNTARPHTACRSVRRRQVCQEGLAALQQLRAANTQQQRCQERRTPPGRRLRVFMDSLVFFSTTTVLHCCHQQHACFSGTVIIFIPWLAAMQPGSAAGPPTRSLPSTS